MAAGRTWISAVITEFQKSPLWSNVIFSCILVGLEKLLEVEFVCPCNPKWNGLFAAAYFVVPVVVVFLLMMNIQGFKTNSWKRIKDVCSNCTCKCCSQSTAHKVVWSSIPSFVWLILMFLDGRYLVCALTYWTGRFVFLPEAAPQKWCKPIDQTSTEDSTGELMKKIQEWFCLSQGIGIVSILILALPLFCITCCKNSEEDSNHRGRCGLRDAPLTHV